MTVRRKEPSEAPAQNTYVRVGVPFILTHTLIAVKKTTLSLAACNVCRMTTVDLMSFTGEMSHEVIKKHGKSRLITLEISFLPKETAIPVMYAQSGAT